MSAKDIMVLYHADCVDGFTAAWCVWKLKRDRADYVPVYYSVDTRPPPAAKGKKEVHLADISFDREHMLQLAADNDQVYAYEHHKTAQDQMLDLPENVHVEFDLERSGAGIAWDYLSDGSPRSWLVDYVEDRDLWRFDLGNSRDVNAYLQSRPQTFEEWERLWNLTPQMVRPLGEAIRGYVDHYAERAVATGAPIELLGYRTFAVNVQYLGVSETLHRVLERIPEAQVALGWHVHGSPTRGGHVHYSLRSRTEDDVDVTVIARTFGGGGHKNAAGFEVPYILGNLF